MSLEGKSSEEIQKLEKELIELVRKSGGTAGNISLLRELGWPDNQYWALRDRLLNSGTLLLGKGKGGSVRLIGEEQEADREQEEEIGAVAEAELYDPLSLVLKERWVRDQRFERSIVEISARQGRRDTGGRWTRPDLIVVSYTTLLYIPGRDFEVVTFEVKPWSGLDVTGLYEALAHRRASTRAYLLAHIPQAVMDKEGTEGYLQKIQDEAKRHGIGFVVVTDASDYGTWDERVEAARHEPAPYMLNDFLSLQLTDGAKDELLAWFR